MAGFLGGLQGLPSAGPGASLGSFLQGAGGAGGGLAPGSNLGRFGPGTLPGGGAAQAGGQSPLSGLQGFKGPEPIKPEFAGGIRGAQQAPQQNFAAANPQVILQQLQQLLQGPPGGGPPDLGSLLGRR